MAAYLGRLWPHPQPRVPGGQLGAHLAHQLVRQRHRLVRAPPYCPKYLRFWRSWPVVAFLRLCVRIPRALRLFLGVLRSFCRRCHQRACAQGRVMTEQEEHPRVLERVAHQERGLEDRCHQKPQASVRSSCCWRNSITSSYSSTRGFLPVERRRQPATCHTRPSQRVPKTVSQQDPQVPSCNCLSSQRQSQPDSGPGDTRPQRSSSRNLSPSCDRPRKRKFPLLPRRQGDPLRLPPAPQLGYRVTPEDIDAEKRALWQHISSALWVTQRPSRATVLQSLCVLPRSLPQGLVLSLLLAPRRPPACQAPLQAVPAPQPAHPQAWLPNQLPTPTSPQWTRPRWT